MTIEAKIILDSVSLDGIRIITYELMYPRFIHSELMTHRFFSRNASSSRAIPVKKMIDNIRKDPAMPVHWGQNQPGMQADVEIADPEVAKQLWLEAAKNACDMAERMLELNIHKQIVNRITEAFAHIKVLVTATEWDNFFELRTHKDAQPEFQALAKKMKHLYDISQPQLLAEGQWHIPFVRGEEMISVGVETALKLSTARCARVSYLNHDGTTPDIEKDIDLYNKLIVSKPTHASPCEHQATPAEWYVMWSGNFRGWKQYRKMIEDQLSDK